MKKSNPYTGLGKKELLPSLCVYFDILGSKNSINNSLEFADQQSLFQTYYKAITEKSGLIRKKNDVLNWRATSLWHQKIFSDNIVMGSPVKTYDAESEFGHLILQLSYIQMSLVLENFFIRGGFSSGNLYIDDIMVFGDALLEAYKIENEIAINPRIVISNEVMQLVNLHLTYYGKKEEAPHNSDILIDADNQTFVNYLVTTIGDEGYLFDEALFKHKEIIEGNLKVNRSNPKIFSKYVWVANYHNYFCKTVRDYDGYSDSMLIKNDLIIQEPRRLVEIIK